MFSNTVKAMVIDIDGVITDLSHFHYLSWRSAASQFNIELTEKKWEKYNHHSRKQIAIWLLSEHDNLCNDKNIKLLGDLKSKIFQHLINNFLSPKFLNQTFKNILKNAKERGLKLIAWSASSSIEIELERLGIRHYFDVVWYNSNSNNSGAIWGKEGLLEILGKMGILTKECIGLEDSYYGIQEYNKLGIFSIGVYNNNPDDIKSISKYWINNTSKVDLDELLFAYYQQTI